MLLEDVEVVNSNQGIDINESTFHVCPVCGNIITAALEHLAAHPELKDQLATAAAWLRSALKERGVRFKETLTPIVPIYTTDRYTTLRIVHDLYEEGVFVNAVLPPATAENECLIRTSLMANISRHLIEEAADKIAEVLGRYL